MVSRMVKSKIHYVDTTVANLFVAEMDERKKDEFLIDLMTLLLQRRLLDPRREPRAQMKGSYCLLLSWVVNNALLFLSPGGMILSSPPLPAASRHISFFLCSTIIIADLHLLVFIAALPHASSGCCNDHHQIHRPQRRERS
jgi:hypothetical protein